MCGQLCSSQFPIQFPACCLFLDSVFPIQFPACCLFLDSVFPIQFPFCCLCLDSMFPIQFPVWAYVWVQCSYNSVVPVVNVQGFDLLFFYLLSYHFIFFFVHMIGKCFYYEPYKYKEMYSKSNSIFLDTILVFDQLTANQSQQCIQSNVFISCGYVLYVCELLPNYWNLFILIAGLACCYGNLFYTIDQCQLSLMC